MNENRRIGARIGAKGQAYNLLIFNMICHLGSLPCRHFFAGIIRRR
jgi:ubiquitin C-terminal hydrolase